jgi:hypothetical protein
VRALSCESSHGRSEVYFSAAASLVQDQLRIYVINSSSAYMRSLRPHENIPPHPFHRSARILGSNTLKWCQTRGGRNEVRRTALCAEQPGRQGAERGAAAGPPGSSRTGRSSRAAREQPNGVQQPGRQGAAERGAAAGQPGSSRTGCSSRAAREQPKEEASQGSQVSPAQRKGNQCCIFLSMKAGAI